MKRQSNIELLRIFAMLGVVFLHYYNPSIGEASILVERNSPNFFILNFFESTFICAVNVFILICGYFSSRTYKRNLIKPIQLVIQVIIINVVKYLAGAVLSKNFSISTFLHMLIPNNWFVILYIVLFILSPYINIVIDSLKINQLKKLVFISLCIFSIATTTFDLLSEVFTPDFQISPIGIYGNQDGYTIINFVLMYLIGAYLAKCDTTKIKLKIILGLLLINNLIIFASMYYFDNVALAYCNPFVISEAILFFLLFSKINIKNNTFINTIAKGAFSVYLLHFAFYSYINIPYFVNQNPFILISHIIISICAIYFVCSCIGFVYEKITDPIFNSISKKHPNLIWNIKSEDNTK